MCKESVPAKKEGYGEDVREMEFAPMFGLSTQNQCINLHKVLCTPFILSMMYLFDNWSLPAQLYLFAHGTYSIMWLVKYAAFPPKNFEQKVPLSEVPVLMTVLSVYWLTPYVLCKNTREISPLLMMAALVIYQAGIFLHYVGDCQLHFTLLYKGPSLVDSGMYARTRNPGYLGEILIYFGYALLAQHWLPWVVNSIFWFGIFRTNMMKKDKSISRHKGFAEYAEKSGMLFPIFSLSDIPALFVSKKPASKKD